MISAIRVFLLCMTFLVGVEQIEAAVLIVDSSQSQVAISGQVSGYTFTAQGSGSLTAAYKGYVNATVSGSIIQFTGLSAVAAITNGVWQPAAGGAAGSAPADYGAQVSFIFFGTAYGALRNLVLDITSPLLTVAQTNFDSSKLIFSIVTNSNPVLDFNATSLGYGSGSGPLSGDATNLTAAGSSVSASGGLVRLVVQVNTTLADTNGTTLTFAGQIVATNSVSAFAPPVITQMAATNQNLVLTVTNAFTQSRLLSSTNLTTWSPASATVSTNGGFVIFTTPKSGPNTYFRVQK